MIFAVGAFVVSIMYLIDRHFCRVELPPLPPPTIPPARTIKDE